MPGTFFPKTLKHWNLSNIQEDESVIHMLPKDKWLDGIHNSYLYIGMRFSAFALHAENKYLSGASYNHHGAPKIWYAIKRSDRQKLIELANGSVDDNDCSHLLFHKSTMITPKALDEANITYKIVRHTFFLLYF